VSDCLAEREGGTSKGLENVLTGFPNDPLPRLTVMKKNKDEIVAYHYWHQS